MTTLALLNARVIDPAQKLDQHLNVLVRNGKIAELTSSTISADEVIDAKGCVVCPGLIDPHVHLREPGFEYKEDIASGSQAAVAGGFTTICCMANTNPVNDCASVTAYIIDRAKQAQLAKVLPIGAVSRGLKGELLADIGDMAGIGIVAISDDGRPVMNSSLMRRAMEYAKAFDIPVITHAEDLSLAKGVMSEGRVATELGLKGIPHASEEIMIARDIFLAELTGAHLHVAHLSSKGSLDLIHLAKARGIKVTSEVSPHHLTLTDEAVRGYNVNAKMHPPLRTEADRQALIAGLADGTIDIIATDHAPHGIVDKEAGFDLAASGIVGLETSLPIVLSLVQAKQLTLPRVIEAMTTFPAQIFNLKGRGRIKQGDEADITVFNPSAAWSIDASTFFSKSRNTPYDGWKVTGKIVATIVSGRVVYRGNNT